MKKPFVSIWEVRKHPVLGRKTIESLKRNFEDYRVSSTNIFITSSDQIKEELFPKVLAELEPLSPEEKAIVQSMFETFLGAIHFGKEVQFAFDVLETSVEGKFL